MLETCLEQLALNTSKHTHNLPWQYISVQTVQGVMMMMMVFVILKISLLYIKHIHN